jgi:hypothetical protein
MKATLANTINHTVPAKGGKEGTKREREREREREQLKFRARKPKPKVSH